AERPSAAPEAILLLDRALSGRARLEPPVRNRLAALDRQSVRAVRKPGFCTFHGGEFLEQILPATRVELVLVEILRLLVAGLDSVGAFQRSFQRGQRLLDAGTLAGEELP